MQQTFQVTITTKGDERPGRTLRRALTTQADIINTNVQSTTPAEEVPGPNRKRLIELAVWVAGEHAKQELGLPSEWNQGQWLLRRRGANSCGTACCIAGKVALADGAIPVYDTRGDWSTQVDGRSTALAYFPSLDAERPVDDYAREALGLTQSEASQLFEGSNDLERMLELIRGFLAQTDPEPEEQPEEQPEVAEQVAEEASAPTVRRPRAGLRSPCSWDGCDTCFEDVPADEPQPEPAF
jgi:hypothetical protein